MRLDHLGPCGGLARLHTGILRHLDHLNKIKSGHAYHNEAETNLVHHLTPGVDLLHHLHSPGLTSLHHLHPGGWLLTQALLNNLRNKLSSSLELNFEIRILLVIIDTSQTCCCICSATCPSWAAETVMVPPPVPATEAPGTTLALALTWQMRENVSLETCQ